jgi:hypothetical protein
VQQGISGSPPRFWRKNWRGSYAMRITRQTIRW